jgi:mono/diheme cytochrome c family protein
MDEIGVKWNQAQADHLDCISKSENGGQNDSLLTAPKPAPQSIYATKGSKQTLTWELDFAGDVDEKANRSLPARISVDVGVLYQGTRAIGYVFNNPVMQMKVTGKEIVIEGLFFQINKQAISSQTTFTNLSRVVGGSAPLALMANVNANTLIEPISTADTFQLYIRRISLTSGTEDAPAPLTPIMSVTDTETASSLLLKSRTASVRILRDAGISRWCLSESSTKPASTEAACQSGMTGNNIVNGWSLVRPTSFQFSAGDGMKQLHLWVANQSLKINDQPAVVAVTVDTTAPAAPTIASIDVTDTQVGALNVTHPNESDVKGWCVLEFNAISTAPGAPNLANRCWRWTDNGEKPTTVGFKDGGSRNVRVYVRDAAGNISPASATVNATNPHGAITFSQLTNPGGGPRAIFQNRCFTCHGSSANPGFGRLQLFSFAAAEMVVDNGILLSRINDPLSPMPNVNGGLMPLRERDLIRLWTMPEEGNDPLP